MFPRLDIPRFWRGLKFRTHILSFLEHLFDMNSHVDRARNTNTVQHDDNSQPKTKTGLALYRSTP
jgi:hypothetical protein